VLSPGAGPGSRRAADHVADRPARSACLGARSRRDGLRLLAASAVGAVTGTLVAALSALPAPARAQALRQGSAVAVISADLQARDEPEPGLYLNAQFDFEPTQAIEDAVRRGIPVYFAIDFELVRSRWYWLDKRLITAALVYRISYSPLTRQFRLSRGALAQPYETLAEALATIRTVRDWKVSDQPALASAGHLQARLRLRLDTSMLPKPFQVDTLTNRDWVLASDWHAVPIVADAAH
jgi:hypothetical protein